MMKKIKQILNNRAIMMAILIVSAVLSMFVVSKIVTAPGFNAAAVKSLDDKKVVVMNLTATAAATSTALTLIPGDVATPIANQIAELSTYFIIILCAILLEKMLVATVGFVSFTYIIPFACALGILYLFTMKEILKVYAIKLAIFGIILFAAIPVSMQISDFIYSSYQSSVEQTVESAKQNNDFIEDKKSDLSEEDKNWMEKVGDYLSDLTSKIGTGLSEMTKKGEESLSRFLDAIAVLIITSCVIPIIVLLIFVWIIKILFGFNVRGTKRQDE